MDGQQHRDLMERLRAIASALDAIDQKLGEGREAFERKTDELIAALHRIGAATEDKLL